MSILITGSSGFIGTNICKYLIRKKKSFIGIDLIKNPYINLKKFYKTDLKDSNKLEKIFISNKIKKIIHLAAIPGLNACHNNTKEAFSSNVVSSLNILELSRKYKIKKIILVSSFSVDNFINNPSFYGFTKLAVEQMSLCYNKNFKTPVTSIKLSNIYGPYSLHKKSAIHQFIKQTINNKNLIIHDSGKQTRDFVFVFDVVKIIYKLINQNKIETSYKICSEKKTNLLEIKKLIDKISNKNNLINFVKAPIGYDTKILKNKNKTNIKFEYTALEKGLNDTYNWYKYNLKK